MSGASPPAAEHPYRRRLRELREACVPALEPQDLTEAEVWPLVPETLEYLGGGGDRPIVVAGPEGGRDLLRVLLKRLGLREAVRLAPREAWPAALAETAPVDGGARPKEAGDGR